MVSKIYCPVTINSFISYGFCSAKELTDNRCCDFYSTILPFVISDGKIPVVDDFSVEKLLCIEYNFIKKIWIVYYGSKYLNKLKFDEQTFVCFFKGKYLKFKDLDTCKRYFVLDGKLIQIFDRVNSTIETNGTYYDPIKKEFYYAHWNNFQYDMRLESDNEKRQTDIILMNRNGGFIVMNSSDYMDFILSTLRLGSSNEQVKALVSVLFFDGYTDLKNTMNKFCNDIEHIQKIEAKKEYGQVNKLFSENDNEYHRKKITVFTSDVMKILKSVNELATLKRGSEPLGSELRFGIVNTIPNPEESLWDKSKENMINFITNFIIGLKKDICAELFCLYHRYRLFPREKVYMYNKFSKHSYIKLLKKLHGEYVKTKKYVTPEFIQSFLFDGENKFINRSEIIIELLSAIKTRNELFVDAYKQYLKTVQDKIKPKYKTNYNYFPFKIFSSKLFILEHLLMWK